MKKETSAHPSRKQKAAKQRPYRVHPAALILLAVGALCFSAAAFLSAYIVPPPNRGVMAPPNHGGLYEDDDQNADSSDTALPSETSGAANVQTPSNAGMVTVLLVGTEDDFNTDTIMVARLDVKNATLNVVSIPRDTKVSAKNRSLKKINGAYGNGKEGNDSEKGINALRTELASLIGFYPDYYALVDMKAFVELVDALDGVKFNVPRNMYKPTDGLIIDLKEGEQILDGNKALQLVRYRGYTSNDKAGVSNDDFGRIEMQQLFLKAVAKQTLQIKNIFKVDEFVKIAQDNVKTDIEARYMLWFAMELMKLDAENIHFATLPVNPKENPQSYVYVKPAEALTMINEMINPFLEDITAQNVKHVTS